MTPLTPLAVTKAKARRLGTGGIWSVVMLGGGLEGAARSRALDPGLLRRKAEAGKGQGAAPQPRGTAKRRKANRAARVARRVGR